MPRGSPRLRTQDDKLNGVGQRALERRLLLKLAQDAVCVRIVGVTKGRWNPDRQEIYKIEDGRRTVTDLELVALSKALDCSPLWLLTGEPGK